MKIKLVEADRPDTPEGERKYLLQVFRKALTDSLDVLGIPGSPSLLDVPRYIRERLGARNETRAEKLIRVAKELEELNISENWDGTTVDPQYMAVSPHGLRQRAKMEGGGDPQDGR